MNLENSGELVARCAARNINTFGAPECGRIRSITYGIFVPESWGSRASKAWAFVRHAVRDQELPLIVETRTFRTSNTSRFGRANTSFSSVNQSSRELGTQKVWGNRGSNWRLTCALIATHPPPRIMPPTNELPNSLRARMSMIQQHETARWPMQHHATMPDLHTGRYPPPPTRGRIPSPPPPFPFPPPSLRLPCTRLLIF